MSDRYENPLCKRYASGEMQFIFSDDSKFSTWRRLWTALAESHRELGFNIRTNRFPTGDRLMQTKPVYEEK